MKRKPKGIDWVAQWAMHGADFRDGFVHVAAGEKVLRLEPGPGFGDLSHPTTKLVIAMMAEDVKGKIVLDVGSGSGILSLCAIAHGADYAYGVDIDPKAVKHAEKNSKLNGMESKTSFSLTRFLDIDTPFVVLMNMISSEQREAWVSLSSFHSLATHCVISGILKEERAAYLEQASARGWSLLSEQEMDGWLGFRFDSIHR